MDVVVDLSAGAQAAKPVQVGERVLHCPALGAQAGAVRGAAPGEVRGDLEPDLVPVDLVVIAAVGVQLPGAALWLAARAADRRDGLDQRDQVGDVVAVAAGGGCRERDAVRLDDQMVRAAGFAPATGDGPVAGLPFIARMWLESTAAWEKSSGSAARSSESSSSCRRCQTPASFQSRSRRRQVVPELMPSSWGRNSQRIPVYGTSRIPHSTLRLSGRLLPGRPRCCPRSG